LHLVRRAHLRARAAPGARARHGARAEEEFREAERKLRDRDNALDYAYRQAAEAFNRSQQIPRELGALKKAGPGRS